jgi:hypothetical protein
MWLVVFGALWLAEEIYETGGSRAHPPRGSARKQTVVDRLTGRASLPRSLGPARARW